MMHILARVLLFANLVYWIYWLTNQGYDAMTTVKVLVVVFIPAILGYLSVNRSLPKDGLRRL